MTTGSVSFIVPTTKRQPSGLFTDAGLLLSHHPTFLTASRSLVQLSQNGSLRQAYSSRSLPRIHFHGTTEFSEASRQFLAEQSLAYVAFEGIGHWLMREAEQEFYQRLGDWLSRW